MKNPTYNGKLAFIAANDNRYVITGIPSYKKYKYYQNQQRKYSYQSLEQDMKTAHKFAKTLYRLSPDVGLRADFMQVKDALS